MGNNQADVMPNINLNVWLAKPILVQMTSENI